MKKVETWYKAEGYCAASDFEFASFLLFEAGVETLEELDSKDISVTPFCFYTDDKEKLFEIINKFPEYHFTTSEEEARDWDKWWKDRATPVQVTKHLWVIPPWINFTPKEDEFVLELEAKTAFGTGEHETTSSTATLMEAVDFKDKTVLDIGTGTGILAMYAEKLGAKLAVGTEIDPLAIPCIAENFERNGFRTSNAILGFLDAFKDDTKFDVILCNMIRSELWPLREDIEYLLNENGSLIISGQLESEKDYIRDWFKECNFSVEKELVKGEWWSVLAINKANT